MTKSSKPTNPTKADNFLNDLLLLLRVQKKMDLSQTTISDNGYGKTLIVNNYNLAQAGEAFILEMSQKLSSKPDEIHVEPRGTNTFPDFLFKFSDGSELYLEVKTTNHSNLNSSSLSLASCNDMKNEGEIYKKAVYVVFTGVKKDGSYEGVVSGRLIELASGAVIGSPGRQHLTTGPACGDFSRLENVCEIRGHHPRVSAFQELSELDYLKAEQLGGSNTWKNAVASRVLAILKDPTGTVKEQFRNSSVPAEKRAFRVCEGSTLGGTPQNHLKVSGGAPRVSQGTALDRLKRDHEDFFPIFNERTAGAKSSQEDKASLCLKVLEGKETLDSYRAKLNKQDDNGKRKSNNKYRYGGAISILEAYGRYLQGVSKG